VSAWLRPKSRMQSISASPSRPAFTRRARPQASESMAGCLCPEAIMRLLALVRCAHVLVGPCAPFPQNRANGRFRTRRRHEILWRRHRNKGFAGAFDNSLRQVIADAVGENRSSCINRLSCAKHRCIGQGDGSQHWRFDGLAEAGAHLEAARTAGLQSGREADGYLTCRSTGSRRPRCSATCGGINGEAA
jgi:hypothetical protein